MFAFQDVEFNFFSHVMQDFQTAVHSCGQMFQFKVVLSMTTIESPAYLK